LFLKSPGYESNSIVLVPVHCTLADLGWPSMLRY